MLWGWSESTWDRILLDTAVGVPPTEDQITQELLSTLAHRFGHLSATWWNQTRYSGSSEGGQDGPNADWDWWVADSAGWAGLRIQAKKIDPATAYYPDLNANSKKKREQASLLIGNAAGAAGSPAPAYCFYNAWDDPPPPAAGNMGRDTHRRDWGATLVPAAVVLDALNTRLASGRGKSVLGFDTFLDAHWPLGAFFCQEETPRQSVAAWGADVVPDSPGADDDEEVPTHATPDVVQSLLMRLSPNLDVAAAGEERLLALAEAPVETRAVLIQVQDDEVLERALASIT